MDREPHNEFDRGAGRAGRGWGWVLVALAVIIAAGLGALYLGSPDQRSDIAAAGPGDSTQPVATGGALDGPPESVLGTAVAGLLGGNSDEDLARRIGEEVELEVDAAQLGGVTFWTGDDDALLVVIGRDSRSAADHQRGVPSASVTLPASGRSVLRGVVERVSYPEETYSWGLSRPEVQRLLDRGGVYLRVQSAQALGAATEAAGTAQERVAPSPDSEPPGVK